MVCLIIFLLWALYFSRFREQTYFTVPRAYSWTYIHYPFHVALILVLQACNSLMLFANVWNPIDSLGTNPQTTGDIVNTFYPAPPGAPNTSVTLGDVVVSWEVSTLFTNQFLHNSTILQATVLSFNLFQKIFSSYSLQTPSEFNSLYQGIIMKQTPVTEDTISKLILILIYRFILSAQYYFIACVTPTLIPRTTTGRTFCPPCDG